MINGRGMKIAIDGPGSAGKSTVAKLVAKKLGITYIDTGAMYRAVALAVLRLGIPTGDEAAVLSTLDGLILRISHDTGTGDQHIYLSDEDVTPLIRAPQVSIGASDVSRIPGVRIKLVEQQRRYAEEHPVIMDGRDIGTYVFPDADKKYFLTASAGERARRRYLELRAKGEGSTYAECLAGLMYRDENDSTRAFAPLSVADDALYIESDNMIAREVADYLLDDIKNVVERQNIPARPRLDGGSGEDINGGMAYDSGKAYDSDKAPI